MSAESFFSHARDNPSMPAVTVIPVLHYPNVPVAAAWLCRAFGFTERLRISSHRVQLSVGQGAVILAQSSDFSSGVEAASHSVMVRVSNVDQHCEKASKAGADVIGQPTSFPYGERQYTVLDLAGHVWTFSQTEFGVEPSTWGGQLLGPGENAA